jgi:integrase
MPVALVAVLREHREAQQLDRKTLGAAYKDGDLVFALADGSVVKPAAYGKAVLELLKRCGLEGATLHSLRDTHASLLAAAGVPIEVVSKRLGHSTIAITMERYLDVYTSRDRAAAEAFGSVLAAKTPA